MSEPNPNDATFDRLDVLMSAFFDDALNEEDVNELNEMLLQDAEARTRCFESAQLHADLVTYYREKAAQESGRAVAPSLSGLGGIDLPGLSTQ